MRVLVTGSSGQLGAALVDALSPEHKVIGLDVIPGRCTDQVGTVANSELVFKLVNGADAVLHTASLHARHLNSHSRADFVQSNVQGTLNLLEAAVEHGVRRFVYTSTTSLYGKAMVAPDRAVWVTEALPPQPRDIYDVTKIAAEGLCQITADQHGLSCISLRVSRFFNEPERLQAIYRLYRGIDPRDVVAAHLLALHADLPGFEVFNISAHSPFRQDELVDLYQNPKEAILRHYPQAEEAFTRHGWAFPEHIDRAYVTQKAEQLLGYRSKYNFEDVFLA